MLLPFSIFSIHIAKYIPTFSYSSQLGVTVYPQELHRNITMKGTMYWHLVSIGERCC